MNEIINIQDMSEYPVSGRELQERLEIETRYNDWFKRMCEYGFEAGKDFEAITQKRVTAQGNETTYTDHRLTLSMAKELCMLQRTDKGREVRRYLISIENAWNSPTAIMARALTIANEKMKALQGEVLHLTEQAKEMQPKADYFDALVDRNLLTNIRETAKELKEPEREFVRFLMNKRYMYRDDHGKLMPYAPHVKNELFEVKEYVSEKTGHKGTQALITPKGRETFRLLLKGGQTMALLAT